MRHSKATRGANKTQDEPSSLLRQLRASAIIVLVLAGVAALMVVSQLLGMAVHWAMALE